MKPVTPAPTMSLTLTAPLCQHLYHDIHTASIDQTWAFIGEIVVAGLIGLVILLSVLFIIKKARQNYDRS